MPCLKYIKNRTNWNWLKKCYEKGICRDSGWKNNLLRDKCFGQNVLRKEWKENTNILKLL